MTKRVADIDRQQGFLRHQLAGLEPLKLPTDRPRPPVRSASSGSVVVSVDTGVAQRLRGVAEREGITLFTALLSVFQVLLSRYSGQDDVAVGTPAATQGHPETGDPMGSPVKALVLCGNLSGDPTVVELFRRTSLCAREATSYQDVPITPLAEDLVPKRDQSQTPPFQAWFELRCAASGEGNIPWLGDEPVDAGPTVCACDLAMTVQDRGAELHVSLKYSNDLFEAATAARMAGQFRTLLAGMVADPFARLSDLEMLSDAERQQILVEWNDTAADYPRHLCIHQLVEQQAAASPDAVAVVFENAKLSYKALNERANQLAHHLLAVGVGPQVLVGICLERGPEMIIGILAILKAGGAYVPMDPAYPAGRLALMLEDTAAPVVVTQTGAADHLPVGAACTVVRVDADRDAIAARPSTDSTPMGGPDDLAYVIYTSGSTGTPKGVQVRHRNVVCRTWEMRQRYGLTAGDSVLQFASISFDSSVEQIFPALTVGASLVMRGKDFDPADVLHSIRRHRVTVMQAPPSVWGQIMSSDPAQVARSTLRTVIFAGEAAPPSLLARWFEHSQTPIYNAYGPSETTVTATMALIQAPTSRVPIGRPIANTEVFVMDRLGRPVPIGVQGELWIGGAGVAKGYLNRPELTAERFVPHPFSDDPEARVYRTGDVVRWSPDGDLEFVGRADDQVKVRGFRIELGEIEAALGSHESVGSCVVVAREDEPGDKRLVAYVQVEAAAGVPTPAQLRSHLQERLPDYMVPSAFVALEAFPLTPNGKVDRTALPAPAGQRTDVGDKYVAPRHELEEVLADIWTDVLGVGRIGVHDDFFRVGGDSIVAIQLLGRLRQRFGVHLPVRELLERSTIARLGEFLECQLAASRPDPSREAGAEGGEAPLLEIQRWFFRSDFARPNHWNQAFLIATPQLEVERLRECVRELGLRHGAFRLRYRRDAEGQVVQYYTNNHRPTDLVVGSLAEIDDLEAQLTAWQSDFDLEHGPVYRIGYVNGLADGTARVFFACHHLVVDAVSWRILAEDLETLYTGRSLPAVGSSYGQWSTTMQQYASKHPEERNYWQQVQSECDQTGAAAIERLVTSDDTRTVSRLTLNRDSTKRLVHCHRTYGTQINDVLLAAFAHAMTDLTGESVNHIILEGHGREEVESGLDVGRTVGWFTTMFPVRLETGTDQLTTLRDTKETLRGIPAKGIGYGAFHGYHDDRLPRINFNYLGRLNAEQAAADGTLWRLTWEPVGVPEHPANHDTTIMRINAWISDGRFSFTVSSNLGQEAGDRLIQRYEQCLVGLVEELSSASRAYLTPVDVDHVVSPQHLDELQATREIDGVYLANSLQQGFIYQAVTQGWVDDAYTVQMTWQYATAVETGALREAWVLAQRAFPALRLRFDWMEEPLQIIDADAMLDWRYIDLSDRPVDEAEAVMTSLREADRAERYHLEAGRLFRLYLVKRGPSQYSCIFSHHHSILDGWSNTVLVNQVHEWYEALVAGLPIDTTHHSSYQSGQKYLQEHRHDHKDYWREKVAQYDERMDLEGLLRPDARADGLRVGTARRVREMRELSFTISGEQFAELRRFIQDSAVSANSLMLYVWHKTLACYAGTKQTITGVVLSGRGIPVNEIDTSVGLFINCLPHIMVHETGDESVLDGVRAVQQGINELNAHSTVNLADLHEGADRLFNTLFIYENWPKIESQGWRSRLAVSMGADYEKLDYPLSVIVSEAPDSIRYRLMYAAELFDARYMTDMLDVQRHLLEEVLAEAKRPWREVDLLSDAQQREVIGTLNPPAEWLPEARTFVEEFEEQAYRHPERSAVSFRGSTISYRSLDERANRLAHWLIEAHAVQPQELVVLCLDKGLELLSSILAVLKARAAYVLTDPVYPDSRFSYILRDTAARLVLTTDRYAHRLSALGDSDHSAFVLALDAPEVGEALAEASPTKPSTSAPIDGLMYVLYTSGTTGVPKGVMIEHRAFSQTIAGMRARYFADLATVNTHSLTNHVFDIFGLEYGLSLWTGGHVVLETELPASLDCTGLDFVQMTPSVCDLMLDRLVNLPDDFLLLVGGERLPEDLLDRVLARSIDLVNVYGPTETTIWSTSERYRCKDGQQRPPVSLGVPFAGEAVYVLDDALRPLPMGAVGELCIAGDGLARGYLNQEELTAQRFISARFGAASDTRSVRLYRTGDVVRVRSSGTLEFIGRNDTQVKINGYRIELREIEGALCSHPAVRQSVVLVLELGTPTLVGYYVADPEILEEVLDEHLRRSLPRFMVPARCIQVESVPLTINGKVDRAALPRPSAAGARIHVPPRSRVEADLCALAARLLGLDPIDVGIDDDFFQLGGTSLLSIKLVSAMERELGISTTVGYLLAHRTIREFVGKLEETQSQRVVIPTATFTKPEDQALSFAQERLWFIERFACGTSAYNLPLVLEVADHTDTETLLAAVRGVIAWHDVLRTLLKETPDGIGYQVVLDAQTPTEIEVVRVTTEQAMRAAIRRDQQRVFDFGVEVPVRVRLYEVPELGRRLVFVIHHIAFDGWSTDVLLEDLHTAYDHIAQASPGADPLAGLPAPQLRYRDFAVWQRNYLTGERLERLRRFWQEKLEDYQDLSVVPDRPWPDSPDYRGAHIRLDVGAEVSQRLRRLAEELRVSLFSLLLSAHFLTLRCFTNQDDIVVGTPIANRDHPQLARLIGFFVNTLPLRSRIDGKARITDYVRQTAREVLDVLRHQELPLEQLLEILNVERNVSRHPIFQVTFGVQSFGTFTRGSDASSQAVLRISPETYSLYTAARFDLSTFIDDSAESLELNINYATSLFERATVDSLAQTYLTILRQFADLAWSEIRQRQFKISDLVYVDGSRRQELVEEWSAPRKWHDSEMLLHRTFETHASHLPQRVALVWEDRPRTYRELNAEANRLAHHLLMGGKVAPNSIVLLCLDRGADIVVSILATLKAGGCYLPADPTYPDDRIAFMLHDAGVRTILIHSRYADRFAEILARAAGDDGRPVLSDIDVIAVDDPTVQALFRAMPETDPITEVTPSDLAYVLYTSGTTGKPKGVPQPHANVARLFAALEGVYHIREDDVWTLFHNFVFDFTVWEMWGAYLNGGRLVVPTFEETRDPKLFYALCRRERVTMLCQTPTAFYQFVNVALAMDESHRLDDLRYIFFGGEPLNVSLLKEWFARYSYDRPLLAMGYGTTETTIFTCYKIYDETDEGSTNIGTLIPDVAGYVLDEQHRLLPMGAVGELHIGGAGLAPGFLNLPDLTASKFITNPFVADSGRSGDEPTDILWHSRLYKSGDLVRWAPDRTLRFVGRNDLQVKIRGHRIELGEIEAVMSGVPGVLHCTVVVRKSGAGGGDSQLVGYYVAESDVDTDVVFEHLQAKLPLYMIPAALVPMDELPRRISGKLDVNALPAPRLDTMHGIVAPRNERQAKALRVLAEILCVDVEALSIHDNFFELGGNSILSIKLASRLSVELEMDVKVAAIFRHGSVAGLVDSLGTGHDKPPRIPRSPERPDTEQVLSFQQESLWFVDRYEGGTDAYNIHLCYEVLPGVALNVLEDSFRAVYKRHEVLRTVIRQRSDGELYQLVLNPGEVPLTVVHATVSGAEDLAARIRAEASRQFDLAGEPPFRITFYREAGHDGSQGRTFVGIFAHHIAFDGWSADVMLHELERFCADSGQVRDGAAMAPGLPELAIQYRDYAAWQRERLSGDRLRKLLEYWKARVHGRKPLNLPLDRPRPPRADYRGERLVFEIDADTSSSLRRLASEAGVGLFSVLLSAYYLMLRTFSGRNDLLVGVPVANRSHGQTHDLIGCFINTLALDFEIDSDDDVLTLIKKVGARVAEAQEREELPFERLVAELNLPVDNSRHPLVQVWFDVHTFAHTGSVGETDLGPIGNLPGRPALLRYYALDGHSPVGESAATSKKLDLGLLVVEGESLVGTLTYAASLFKRRTVDGFADLYQRILMQFARLI